MGKDKVGIFEDLKKRYPEITQDQIEHIAKIVIDQAMSVERKQLLTIISIHLGLAAAERVELVRRIMDRGQQSKDKGVFMMFEDHVEQHMTKTGCSPSEALRHVISAHPSLHKSYIERAQEGKTRAIHRPKIKK